MSSHGHNPCRPSPKAAGWWVRLFVGGVFAFHLNYIPIHLATAAHLDGALESLTELVFHDDHDHPAHHDSNEHVPHAAFDHTLTLTARTPAQETVTLPVVILAADTFIALPRPPPATLPPVFEHLRPPGESPPNPLQPRAPPLV